MATRNRYAELMAQYQQAQPFSFSGYPSTYTGGYDISQPQAYAAPVNKYEEIMARPVMRSGGRTITSPNPIGYSNEELAVMADESPLVSGVTQYATSPYSLLGVGLRIFDPVGTQNRYLAAQGVNPTAVQRYKEYTAGNDERIKNLESLFGPNSDWAKNEAAAAAAAQAAQAAADAAAAQARAEISQVDAQVSGGGRSGGGYSGAPSGGSDVGRSPPGSVHAGQQGYNYSGGNSSSNYKGGPISMHNLQGPDPMGPDDGYASLKDGEYVINDKAVKKYGIELMNAINSGKISKGKLRGLLEM